MIFRIILYIISAVTYFYTWLATSAFIGDWISFLYNAYGILFIVGAVFAVKHKKKRGKLPRWWYFLVLVPVLVAVILIAVVALKMFFMFIVSYIYLIFSH